MPSTEVHFNAAGAGDPDIRQEYRQKQFDPNGDRFTLPSSAESSRITSRPAAKERSGFQDIDLEIASHHLIYGGLNEIDAYNWTKKVEVAAQQSGYAFDEFSGGYAAFLEEFKRFFPIRVDLPIPRLCVAGGVSPYFDATALQQVGTPAQLFRVYR